MPLRIDVVIEVAMQLQLNHKNITCEQAADEVCFTPVTAYGIGLLML